LLKMPYLLSEKGWAYLRPEGHESITKAYP